MMQRFRVAWSYASRGNTSRTRGSRSPRPSSGRCIPDIPTGSRPVAFIGQDVGRRRSGPKGKKKKNGGGGRHSRFAFSTVQSQPKYQNDHHAPLITHPLRIIRSHRSDFIADDQSASFSSAKSWLKKAGEGEIRLRDMRSVKGHDSAQGATRYMLTVVLSKFDFFGPTETVSSLAQSERDRLYCATHQGGICITRENTKKKMAPSKARHCTVRVTVM